MRTFEKWMIISYNTEGAGNENNIVVLPGAISINPINLMQPVWLSSVYMHNRVSAVHFGSGVYLKD